MPRTKKASLHKPKTTKSDLEKPEVKITEVKVGEKKEKRVKIVKLGAKRYEIIRCNPNDKLCSFVRKPNGVQKKLVFIIKTEKQLALAEEYLAKNKVAPKKTEDKTEEK